MGITWKVIVGETCFCEKIQADYKLSWVFKKYFNFVHMLESQYMDHMKCNCSDMTVSSVFHNDLNFVPMLESRNMDHMKSNCSWDMFWEKNSGGLHTFMSFSEMFLFCTHARITWYGSHKKWLFVRHVFVKQFRRTTHFHELLKNISPLCPC